MSSSPLPSIARDALQQARGFAQSRQDLGRRQQLLSEEERQQQMLARQREIALLRRSFTSGGGALPTSQTGLLGG